MGRSQGQSKRIWSMLLIASGVASFAHAQQTPEVTLPTTPAAPAPAATAPAPMPTPTPAVASPGAPPSMPGSPPAPAALPTLPTLPASPPSMPPGAASTGASPAMPAPPLPPTTGLPAPAVPAGKPADAGATIVPAAPSAPIAKHYSYGTSPLGVLFLPEQITRMKDALRANEDAPVSQPTTFVAPSKEPEPQQVEIKEPETYPVFHLGSIAYRQADDWSLWLSNVKITAKKNATDVTVVHVTPEEVTFAWKPSFNDAIGKRLESKQFSPTEPVKNHLAVVQRLARASDGTITFTLKPNQTFAPAYFSIFEGYTAPSSPPGAAKAAPEGGGGEANKAAAAAPAKRLPDQPTFNDLMRMTQSPNPK